MLSSHSCVTFFQELDDDEEWLEDPDTWTFVTQTIGVQVSACFRHDCP